MSSKIGWSRSCWLRVAQLAIVVLAVGMSVPSMPQARRAHVRHGSSTEVYPRTWGGLHDFLQGVTAYRRGHYGTAESLWRTAVSNTCAIAAYNLALMYFYGAHTPVDQPLGVAWISIAASSEYSKQQYASLRSTWTVDLDAAQRAQAHSDYERLPNRLRYRVKPGQTLLTIAQQFGVSIAALRAMNAGRILPGGVIDAGQTLSIPGS